MAKQARFVVSSLLALIVGWWLFPTLLTYASLHSSWGVPLARSMDSVDLAHGTAQSIFFLLDFLIWLVIALPTAVVLNLLKPRQLPFYTALATLPFYFVVTFVADRGALVFATGVLTWVIAPAISVALVAWVRYRLRPNNSFKPRPLRGSA